MTQTDQAGRSGLAFLTFRQWFWIHKWSSLICTAFLLVLCLTGLPLIFHEEIDDWVDPPPAYASVPADAPRANLDRLVADSRRQFPHDIISTVFVDDDEPQVIVYMAPSWKAYMDDPDSIHWIQYDAHTGAQLRQSDPPGEQRRSFMDIMLRLHVDLFAGLPGELFMGAMGLLFVAALVSGVVLYGPFMKKLDFGTVRLEGSRRLRWLDLHNLLGVVTLAWTLIVGATGVINELSTPLFGLWQMTDVRQMLAPWQGKTPPADAELGSVQAAFDTARRALPGLNVVSLVYPGAPFGSPHHYLLWGHGDRALTARLFSPVLVDARSGALTAVVSMPWYLRLLEVSRPLHFGDYGGLPLKIIWALLDTITIVVLSTGLYLWFARRQAMEARLARLADGHRPLLQPRQASS